MPFDLFVARTTNPDLAMRGRKSWFRKLEPIAPEEFEEAMAGGSPLRRPDGDLWLRHPEDGSPWFAARLNPAGVILLSTSYTNHRYLRNFADMFDLGLHLAEGLGASLFEEVRSSRVDPGNVDELLDEDGDYVGLQVGTFRSVVQDMYVKGASAFEYPIGPIDRAGASFVLELETGALPSSPAELIAAAGLEHRANKIGENVAAIGPEDEIARVHVRMREDRAGLQVTLVAGVAPFAECAGIALEVFDAIVGRFPGVTKLAGLPLDDATMAEVRRRANGLGVEFFEWVYEKDTGRRFAG